jgi:hypothetical protein
MEFIYVCRCIFEGGNTFVAFIVAGSVWNPTCDTSFNLRLKVNISEVFPTLTTRRSVSSHHCGPCLP